MRWKASKKMRHCSPSKRTHSLLEHVLLFLWNRSDASQAGVTISGDTSFLQLWQSSVRVRWG